MRLIDADALNQLEFTPTTEVVPWAFLERYAEFFCADVPYTEFVREAKLFWEKENGERGETEDAETIH